MRELPLYRNRWDRLKLLVSASERALYEEDLEECVRESIASARNVPEDDSEIIDVRHAASLLKHALQNKSETPAATYGDKATEFANDTFASSSIARGILLGGPACYRIGVSVCEELHFTVSEAEQILAKYPEPALKK